MHCGPTCVLDHNTYNLYLSAHNIRGPTVHMGLLYMWANNMWAYTTGGPIIHHIYCGPTCLEGPHVLWAHVYCGLTSKVGPQVQEAQMYCMPTCIAGPTCIVGPDVQ